jgi:hypothetical protein
MGRQSSIRGVFVIPWEQTETDHETDAPQSFVSPGVCWRWTGAAVRLDGPADVLALGPALGADALRVRAARMVPRLLGRTDAADRACADDGPAPKPLRDNGFLLTDGLRAYCATVLRGGRLVLFVDDLPPPDTELWVVRVYRPARARRPAVPPAAEMICFTPGTCIATPWGPRPIEGLRPGNRVLTMDDGPQEILWMGWRDIGEDMLRARPDLRPIRIAPGALGAGRPDGALVVSPAHRMMLGGRAAQALFNTPEVLVAAGDLLNDRTITRVHGAARVRYVHMLFARHQIVWANGIPSESFDPARADLSALMPDQRALLRLACDGLPGGMSGYGGAARRSLSAAEAAILQHDAGRFH